MGISGHSRGESVLKAYVQRLIDRQFSQGVEAHGRELTINPKWDKKCKIDNNKH